MPHLAGVRRGIRANCVFYSFASGRAVLSFSLRTCPFGQVLPLYRCRSIPALACQGMLPRTIFGRETSKRAGLALTAVLLLGSSLPAGAQSRILTVGNAPPPGPAFPLRVEESAAPAVRTNFLDRIKPNSAADRGGRNHPDKQKLRVLPTRHSDLFQAVQPPPMALPSFRYEFQTVAYTGKELAGKLSGPPPPYMLGHNHSDFVETAADFVDTPFAQDIRLSIMELDGGQVQLSGDYRYWATDNLLYGLPGAGTLQAWSVSAQSHPSLRAPRGDESIGITISFHSKAGLEPDHHRHIHVWRCAGWIVGNGRGCRVD